MKNRTNVFLDTSALFSAVYSETGGARVILKLGETGAIQLWIGPWVLREVESVVERKSPKSKAYFARLLDQSKIRVGEEAGEEALESALAAIDYLPDAQIVAEALEVRMRLLANFRSLSNIDFDCLACCFIRLILL